MWTQPIPSMRVCVIQGGDEKHCSVALARAVTRLGGPVSVMLLHFEVNMVTITEAMTARAKNALMPSSLTRLWRLPHSREKAAQRLLPSTSSMLVSFRSSLSPSRSSASTPTGYQLCIVLVHKFYCNMLYVSILCNPQTTLNSDESAPGMCKTFHRHRHELSPIQKLNVMIELRWICAGRNNRC